MWGTRVDLPPLQPESRSARDNGLWTQLLLSDWCSFEHFLISDASNLAKNSVKSPKSLQQQPASSWKPTACMSWIKVVRHVSFVEYLSPLCLLSQSNKVIFCNTIRPWKRADHRNNGGGLAEVHKTEEKGLHRFVPSPRTVESPICWGGTETLSYVSPTAPSAAQRGLFRPKKKDSNHHLATNISDHISKVRFIYAAKISEERLKQWAKVAFYPLLLYISVL